MRRTGQPCSIDSLADPVLLNVITASTWLMHNRPTSGFARIVGLAGMMSYGDKEWAGWVLDKQEECDAHVKKAFEHGELHHSYI